jgi:hypothetical protein
MSNEVKSFVKLSWVVASIACFILPLLVIPIGGFDHWLDRAGEDMAVGMAILTFPAGLFCGFILVLFFSTFFASHSQPSSFYVLLWFGFFVTGYLQWFHLLPYLLDRQNLTTLGLAQTEALPEGKTRRRASRSRRRSRHAPPPPQLADKSVLPFDAVRRTPLEKVISDS